MECVICKDNFENTNKICICNSSYLCNDCLQLSNNNKIKKCPICRRDLEYTNHYKYCNIFFSFFLFNFKLLCTLYIFISGSFYIMYNNNYDRESIINFLQSLFLILFVEPFTNIIYNKMFKIDLFLYQIIKLLFVCLFYYTMYIIDKLNIKFYIYYILIPWFIIPSIILYSIIIYSKIKEYLNILYIKSCKKSIINIQYITQI